MALPMRLSRVLRSPLAVNLLAIYIARVVNIIIPLALVPILARTLTPEVFGLTLLAQAIGLWIVQLVEYGYDFSATRHLSRTDWAGEDWKRVVADTLLGQGYIAFACLLGTVAMFLLIPSFIATPGLLLLAWCYGVLAGLTPRWYFYAREQIAGFTTVSLFSRAGGAVISLLAAILFSSGEGVMLGYAVGSLIGFAWSMWVVLPKIRPLRISLRGGVATLKEGAGIFAFKLSKMFYSLGGVTIIGMFAAPLVVANYAAADRLVRAGVNMTVAFTIAFFPRLSKLVETDIRKARRLFLGMLGVSVALTTIAALIVTANSELVVRIMLGDQYLDAAPLLALLIWVAPLNLFQYCLGTQWMVPLGLDRAFSIIIGICAIIYAGLAYSSVIAGPMILAWANVAAEALLCVALAAFLLFRVKKSKN